MKAVIHLLITIISLSLLSGCIIREEEHGGGYDHHWHGYGHEEHWDHDR